MRFGERFRPAAAPLAWFLGCTVVLAIVAAGFGWRLIKVDRNQEEARIQERLETAADRIVSTLTLSIARIEGRLRDVLFAGANQDSGASGLPNDLLTDDSLLVLFRGDTLEALPASRLLFRPLPLARRPGVSSRVFEVGERLEFRSQDYAAATAAYESLLEHRVRSVRAGALLRIGRVERKARNPAAALEAYRQMSDFDEVSEEGVPVALLGQSAACRLLAELDREAALREQAAALLSNLYSGRWRLSRVTYAYYKEHTQRWLVGADSNGPHEDAEKVGALEKLASAVDTLSMGVEDASYNGASSSATVPSRFWSINVDGTDFIVLGLPAPDGTAFLVAGPHFVELRWLEDLRGLADRLDVNLAFVDASAVDDGSHRNDNEPHAARASAQTGLPWTIRLASADLNGEWARQGRRRTLLVGVLASGLLLLVTGTYFVSRSVAKEMRVARLQSDFVAAVSHEFRSPLTSMRHLTELLASGRVTDEEQRGTFYETLAKESERLHALVEGLLDFRRMEEGVASFRLASIDVFPLLRDVAEAFRCEIGGSGYKLELRVEATGLLIRADSAALTRAVRNLLENAVAYSPDCKTVWLEVERQDDKVAIRVRDRGVGIPKRETKTIFNKFVRGAASIEINRSGTGLGLAMVTEIIKAHGGDLLLESKPGRGSTFTILLPQVSD